jgi:uncharacterized protein (DUF433 family)
MVVEISSPAAPHVSFSEASMQLPRPLVTISSDYLGGTPVFTGTRVPVKTLFDHLEAGDPLAEFLRQFPDVEKDHAIAVIHLAGSRLLLDQPAV